VFERLLLLDINLFPNTGTVQQQDDAVSVFDLGTWLLQHLTLQFALFVLLCDLKSRSRGVSLSAEAISLLWKMLVTYSSSLGKQWGVCCIVYVLDFM